MNPFHQIRLKRSDPNHYMTRSELIISDLERSWAMIMWLPSTLLHHTLAYIKRYGAGSDDGRDLDEVMEQYTQLPDQHQRLD